MLASLPMYFATPDALGALWSDVAARLSRRGVAGVPEALSWPPDYQAHWLDPQLLLSQSCGFPLTHQLSGRVQLVGSFAYDVPGATGVMCKSQLICRRADQRRTLAAFSGATVAFNAMDSQSGYNALRAMVAASGGARPFFRHAMETGSHGQSIEKVRLGLADMAAIDCVTWTLWQDAHPALATELVVFDETEAYPGLPLITSLSTSINTLQALRSSLSEAVSNPALQSALRQLHICGFTQTTLQDYARCLHMEEQARKREVLFL